MLFDQVRNSAYGRAIAAAVGPHSVVLDLGAGLGLHGMMAARAGAKKVYLVEPAPIIEVTRRIVAANGFSNIELLECRAEELELPEPVDLIISVFTGNFLLEEDLLPSLFTARDRCLAPGGKMIPDLAQMQVAPVTAGAYHDKWVACWREEVAELEGLDFSAARSYAANTLYYDSAEHLSPELLASAGTLMELDLLKAEKAECAHACELSVSRAGTFHGWLGWFRMRLGNEWLSTAPDAPAMHWSQVLMPLDPPLDVSGGDRVTLQLRRPEFGDWVWTTRTAQGKQRASTFLSAPPELAKIHKQAEQYQPRGGALAEAVGYTLSRFDGSSKTQAIAEAVFARWPDEFRNAGEAQQFVRKLVDKYG
jgi:predicted RNA methylase